MAKQIIRLTESELHKVIKESVKRILREDDGWLGNARKMVKNAQTKVQTVQKPTPGQRVGNAIDTHNRYAQKLGKVAEPITRTIDNAARTYGQEFPRSLGRRVFGPGMDVAQGAAEGLKQQLKKPAKEHTAGNLIKSLGRGAYEGGKKYLQNIATTPEIEAVKSGAETFGQAVPDYEKHGFVHPSIGAN